MYARVKFALAIAALVGGWTTAGHAETVDVQLDQAKIFRISAPAGTIIIGNPSIADATLTDPQTLVITGHAYGTTNMIILDSEGETISETSLVVGQPTENIVTVFRGAKRGSMSCAPVCQPTAVPGDSSDYYNDALGQTSAHNSRAAAGTGGPSGGNAMTPPQ